MVDEDKQGPMEEPTALLQEHKGRCVHLSQKGSVPITSLFLRHEGDSIPCSLSCPSRSLCRGQPPPSCCSGCWPPASPKGQHLRGDHPEWQALWQERVRTIKYKRQRFPPRPNSPEELQVNRSFIVDTTLVCKLRKLVESIKSLVSDLAEQREKNAA